MLNEGGGPPIGPGGGCANSISLWVLRHGGIETGYGTNTRFFSVDGDSKISLILTGTRDPDCGKGGSTMGTP